MRSTSSSGASTGASATARLGADALHPPRRRRARARRSVRRGRRGLGDAAARWHEPRGQGVRRLPAGRGRCPRAQRVRRRRRRSWARRCVVNPYDEVGTADTVLRALEMDQESRSERMAALHERVLRNDAVAWAGRFIDGLRGATSSSRLAMRHHRRHPDRSPCMPLSRLPVIGSSCSTTTGRSCPSPVVPRTRRPRRRSSSRCRTSPRGRTLPSRSSAAGAALTSVAGSPACRACGSPSSMEPCCGQRVPTGSPSAAAPMSHGRSVSGRCSSSSRTAPRGRSWRRRSCRSGGTTAWRMPSSGVARRTSSWPRWRTCWRAPSWPSCTATRCVEIRFAWANKGEVAARILSSVPRGSFILACGDDRTDEDMFARLPRRAWTVRVGAGSTAARYRVPGPPDVMGLLRFLAAEHPAAAARVG